MSNITPTSSPVSEFVEAAIISTIESASNELIERYKLFLGISPEIAALPFYTQNRSWISKTTFGQFLKNLSGQPESPVRTRTVAEKRPLPPPDLDSTTNLNEEEAPVPPRAKRARSTQMPSIPGRVYITRNTYVSKLEQCFSLPSVWKISKESTAIVLDLRGKTPPRKPDGKQSTVDAWLRQEAGDQDSWKVATNGSRAGAGIPVPLLDGVSCRKVLLKCNGVVACSELDPALLQGYERWELDLEKRQAVFSAQEVQRETEPTATLSVLANFYRAVSQNGCPKPGCEGHAIMVKFTTEPLPKRGKFWFVGCSKWSPDARQGHLVYNIPNNIDESELLKLFNGGQLDLEGVQGFIGKRCTQMFHPTTGLKLKHCKMTHFDINGSLVEGTMGYCTCEATMSIWVPLDDTDLRAVVLLGGQPHNHPSFPEVKPGAEARATAAQCVLAAGGITARPEEVDHGPTTLALLGQPLSALHPAYIDKRKLRNHVHSQRLEDAPVGLEWLGLINAAEEDRKLPAAERYIRTTVSQEGIHMVVTMNPVLGELIHRCRWLACDFTFKRVYGEFNEWEVASFLDGINENFTLARIYSDSMSLQAFRLIWEGFFRAIEATTGRALQFQPFHKKGNLGTIICDADAPQARALGEYFAKINIPAVSGIEEHQPERLLLYAFKSCLFHFNQNANGLERKGATRQDIDYIRSYPSLQLPEDRVSFREWCENHTLDAIKSWYRNKLALPWYLPSVNPFESPMARVIWTTTPTTSNSSESGHVASNHATSTNLPLLSAISMAKKHDQQVAERIQTGLRSCILTNRHNSLQDRISRGLRRTKAKSKKVQAFRSLAEEEETVDLTIEEDLEPVEMEPETVPATVLVAGTSRNLKVKLGDLVFNKPLY